MRSLITILLIGAVLTSCKNDSTERIEKLLEIELPDCYEEVDSPKKKNDNAVEVVELRFPEDCFNKFLDDIANQSPSAYCGTTADYDLTMAFCTLPETEYMTINTISGVLHYEKLEQTQE